MKTSLCIGSGPEVIASILHRPVASFRREYNPRINCRSTVVEVEATRHLAAIERKQIVVHPGKRPLLLEPRDRSFSIAPHRIVIAPLVEVDKRRSVDFLPIRLVVRGKFHYIDTAMDAVHLPDENRRLSSLVTGQQHPERRRAIILPTSLHKPHPGLRTRPAIEPELIVFDRMAIIYLLTTRPSARANVASISASAAASSSQV